MRIQIKTTKLKLNPGIKDFVENQILSLEKFARDIFSERDDIFSKEKSKIKIQVELAKLTKHKKGPFFYAECQMKFPGRLLRAESLKGNLKSAIIEIREEIEEQIKKYKRKAMAKIERGMRKIKRELKVSDLAKEKEGKRVLQEGI